MGDGVRSSHPSCRARPLATTTKSNQILPFGHFFPLHPSLQTEQPQTNPFPRARSPPPSISTPTTATTELFPLPVHERNNRRRNLWYYRLFAPTRVAHGAP